ncbi:MAG TPA: polysaccharide biosynthesis/export family protein [Opitutaceae bacterium]|jgi:protein involved in polysaccharide export with SLBB domain/capsular polysaccharide biosynthesis protein
MSDHNGSSSGSTEIPFDAWGVLDFWRRRWYWLALCTIAMAAAGVYAAQRFWGTSYTATAELVHLQPNSPDESYHPRDLAAASLVLMMQSPEMMERIGATLNPPESGQKLAKRLVLNLDRNNDVADVDADGANRQATVDLVNRYCDAVVAYTQQMQRDEAKDADAAIQHQLAEIQQEQAAAEANPLAKSLAVQALRRRQAISQAATAGGDLDQRIDQARVQLNELQLQYTDAYPLVREQQARLQSLIDLQKQEAARPSPVASDSAANSSLPFSLAELGAASPEEIALAERMRDLETQRSVLLERERALEPFRDSPPGYFRITMPATPSRAYLHRHHLELALFGCLGAIVGLFGSAFQILLGEFFDNRIKTRTDVRRVTQLPLVAALGNLARFNAVQRDQWAFRTWTALQSKLSLSPNHGMVCGVTSAHPGDGRSTWIDLLARAAGACGFRVLTITARPSDEMVRAEADAHNQPHKRLAKPAEGELATTNGSVPLSTTVLAAPGEITNQLVAADGPPRIDLPLPGWVWSLERRKQWGAALEAWRAINNIVIFVELPPASRPETVLLAENVPNLLWLVDSGRSDAAETHTELETLRDARCNLVGAVLNRERVAPVRGRFTRWLGSSAFLLPFGLLLAGAPTRAQAQDAPAPTAALTAPAAAPRAEWQEHLTLGPGDVLDFHLFGSPLLTRAGVVVGPDGRVSYLEADNIAAAGLTVDELRSRMNDELGKFRRSPEVYIIPAAYHSKHYYVLGAVVQKGTFPLDRPVTIVEAVARARGFETGLSGGTIVDSTDLAHAFLARGGRHVAVDFTALFSRGDLSQNVTLQPGDYLYFPGTSGGQVYVIGAVKSPGSSSIEPDAGVLSVIAERGGFLPAAWKGRILVIRGSLDHPKTFTVDLAALLKGTGPDFALEPGDLVYVANRPWYEAQQILDRAAQAFVESATVTWTSLHVVPTGGTTSLVTP